MSRFFSMLLLIAAAGIIPANAEPGTLAPDEAQEIGKDTYVYAYPLVLMDATRKQLTNFETPPGTPGQGPANQFINLREFPDPKFKIVIRPNADTLYSSAWLDLKAEPVVLSVPATDRYFMLPMLSMWSDVLSVPDAVDGSRHRHLGAKLGLLLRNRQEGAVHERSYHNRA